MIQETISICDDIQYAHSYEYYKKIKDLESFFEFAKGEELKQYIEEYTRLVLRYGGRTERSRELEQRLDKQRKYGILQNIVLNLDSGIPQAEAADTPCTEGETDMAKRHKERYSIDGVEHWATGKTKQEAVTKAAEAIAAAKPVKQGEPRNTKTPLFGAYAERWYRLYKMPSVQVSTVNSYNAQLHNHILPCFKDKPLGSITTDDIQQFFLDRAHMSASYTRQMRGLLREIFESAIEDKHITENPEHSRRITMPKNVVERLPLELEEAQDIISTMGRLPDELSLMLAILFYSGIRRGELIALRWENVDFEHNKIQITNGVVYGNGNQPIVKAPKSKAGIRIVPLIPELKAIMKPLQSSGYILFDNNNSEKPITLQMYRKRWKLICKDVNMHNATAHILRHTYITTAEPHTDPKTLQTISGHGDIAITMNRYVHARKEGVQKAAKDFAGMYET